MASGSSANLSRRSIWKPAGSVMSVPSRSMNKIFLDTGHDLQGFSVLGGGADGDADGVGNVLAAVAPDDAGAARQAHRGGGIRDGDEQVIGVARPDLLHGGQPGQRGREASALGE